MLWYESPSNPLLTIYDIKKIATLCKKKGVISVFDNTIPTPILQNPGDLGVDIIVHSASKLMAGHSDVIMGFVSTNNEILFRELERLYMRKTKF